MDVADRILGAGLTCGGSAATTGPALCIWPGSWPASLWPPTPSHRVFGVSGWKGILLWFALCVIGHDLIGWPIYTAADRVLIRTQQRHPGRRESLIPWVNHVRVPVVISGTLLLMFFPLIFRLSQTRYTDYTGLNENAYLANWLAVTAVIFATSSIIYLVRLGLSRRRRAQE